MGIVCVKWMRKKTWVGRTGLRVSKREAFWWTPQNFPCPGEMDVQLCTPPMTLGSPGKMLLRC